MFACLMGTKIIEGIMFCFFPFHYFILLFLIYFVCDYSVFNCFPSLVLSIIVFYLCKYRKIIYIHIIFIHFERMLPDLWCIYLI